MIKEVTLKIEINEDIGTEEEMDEFIEFELGYSGSISTTNPYNLEGMDIIDIIID